MPICNMMRKVSKQTCYVHVNKIPLACKPKSFYVSETHTHLESGRGSVISLEASLGAQQGPFLDPKAQHNQGHTLNYQARMAFLIWGAVGRRWDVTGPTLLLLQNLTRRGQSQTLLLLEGGRH